MIPEDRFCLYGPDKPYVGTAVTDGSVRLVLISEEDMPCLKEGDRVA